jgi:hypothetical protein
VILPFAANVRLANEVLTDVIFGCAAVVTVPAVVALPALTAYVALATVPVTLAPTIELNPFPLPVNTPVLAVMFAAVTVPLTPNPVSVPTDVILPCAAVVTVPAVVAAPDNAPTNVVAVIEALPKLALILVLITADELPFADDVVNVGYAVVEVDVFCNSADALVALATVPVTLAPTSELNPLPLPVNTPVFAVMFAAVIVPFTPSDVNVPTLVMFGCALVVTVPYVPAVATFKLAT